MEPQPLEQAGCTFGPYEGMLVSDLEFAVDGRRFASIAGKVKVQTVQMSEDGARAFAIVETETFRLAAEVDPRAVRVALRANSEPVDGWLELRSATVTRAVGGKATVAIRWPNRFEPVEQSRSRIVPCSELTLLADGQPSSWGDVQLKAGKTTPVMTHPGGPVVGHLRGPDPVLAAPPRRGSGRVAAMELPDLKKLEERGESVRVRLAGDSTAVVGWIDESALEDARVAGLLGMLGSGWGGAGDARLTCSRDVDLFVESGGKRLRVGVLRGNKAVPAGLRDEGGFAVFMPLDRGGAAIFAAGQAPAGQDLGVFVSPQDASVCRMSKG